MAGGLQMQGRRQQQQQQELRSHVAEGGQERC